MYAIVNDLSFRVASENITDATLRVTSFLNICKRLKENDVTNIERIISDRIPVDIMFTKNENLGYVLKQLDKDERGCFFSIFKETCDASELPENPFVFNGEESIFCALGIENILISVCSSIYSDNELVGTIDGKDVSLRNVSQKDEHISFYKDCLGIVIYEANPKHSLVSYTLAGNREVSIMDLGQEDAQEALNKAKNINGKLYSIWNDNYYEFKRTNDNVFHGYKLENLDVVEKKRIRKYIT
ncbi:MAG: hypothetical protein PHX08_03645 [Lachnospiraceae bacterium]|nr:hypothetical protein [Lachnospiraceae bacterium]